APDGSPAGSRAHRRRIPLYRREGRKVTIDELKRIADEFLTEHYGMTLDIPIVRNNRLKTHMGRFIGWRYEEDEELSFSIDIAGFMFEYATDAVIVDTLLHECIHYALCMRG